MVSYEKQNCTKIVSKVVKRSVHGERANFIGLLPGCIEANFCNKYSLELGSNLKKILRKEGTWTKNIPKTEK